MFDQIERLLRAMGSMPETMEELRRMAEAIAFYGKIAFIIAGLAGLVWILRMPVLAIVNILRYKEMRTIDRNETEAAETRAAVEIAQAKKGKGEAVTVEEIVVAAESDYGRIVQALRKGRKNHKL